MHNIYPHIWIKCNLDTLVFQYSHDSAASTKHWIQALATQWIPKIGENPLTGAILGNSFTYLHFDFVKFSSTYIEFGEGRGFVIHFSVWRISTENHQGIKKVTFNFGDCENRAKFIRLTLTFGTLLSVNYQIWFPP